MPAGGGIRPIYYQRSRISRAFQSPLRPFLASIYAAYMPAGEAANAETYGKPSCPVPLCSNFWKSKMVAAAILKNHKLAISPQGFDQYLQNLVRWCKMVPLTAATVKIYEFQKSKISDGRHFENRKIAISLQPCDQFNEIWHSDTYWPHTGNHP